jgi:acyl-CoA synthetase (AMP-forming)/AMP-acid ligase II
MKVHLGLIQELVAELLPNHEAIIAKDRVLTHRDLAERSRRFGRVLAKRGLGCHTERRDLKPWESGHDHVAVYLYNCPEYLEVMYGSYKARAAAVNINYRYKADELHYLLDNSSARAIVYGAAFAPLLAEVRGRLPKLEHLFQIPDESGNPLLPGAIDYEAALASEPPTMLDLPFSSDDLYVLYTGGTTGIPKGVLWRHEDVFYNGLGGNLPHFGRLDSEEKLRNHITMGLGGRSLICLPFMHGAGQWNSFNSFHRGGTIILPDETKRLDAHAVWRAVAQHQADQIGIIGDAFARPLIVAQREGKYDLSSLRVLVSTAAVLSPTVKQELLAELPPVMVIESIGASELGMQAMSKDTESGQKGVPAYQLRAGTVLLKEDRSGELDSSSEETGWITSTGDLCLGYMGDKEKTEATFQTINGKRYAIGGDRGKFLPDGRVLFLGRDSSCINSGGEKIYAEEVERIVKSHPAVYDALVVGIPNERWGQQVTAVMALTPGSTAPTVEELRAHCAPHLADYKLPKGIVIVPEVGRAPNGKPDYESAKRAATGAA